MGKKTTVEVWEGLVDGPEDGPSGPAGDGTFIVRFFKQAAAEVFAKENTCYGRSPASASKTDAPKHVAARWSIR